MSLSKSFGKRFHSSLATSWNIRSLDEWIGTSKQLILADRLDSGHLSDLYITLPTRDGTSCRYTPPENGIHLGYGHHLAFFHPRNPEAALRQDGTDADFCPPEPFTQRMWAGGKIKWNKEPLIVGEKATATCRIGSVVKKGFDKGSPMVFVHTKMDIQMEGRSEASVQEERTHVYLPESANKRVIREVPTDPHPAFSLTYTPSATTLFRFSALTFNGHRIHLDKDYAQTVEGYPERLVHGPLTALMLLETVVLHKPDVQLKYFEYRARNPQIVNCATTAYGVWQSDHVVDVWSKDEAGVVGMTGVVHVHN